MKWRPIIELKAHLGNREGKNSKQLDKQK